MLEVVSELLYKRDEFDLLLYIKKLFPLNFWHYEAFPIYRIKVEVFFLIHKSIGNSFISLY